MLRIGTWLTSECAELAHQLATSRALDLGFLALESESEVWCKTRGIIKILCAR